MHARGIIDHATMADTVQSLDVDTVTRIRQILSEQGMLPVVVS